MKVNVMSSEVTYPLPVPQLPLQREPKRKRGNIRDRTSHTVLPPPVVHCNYVVKVGLVLLLSPCCSVTLLLKSLLHTEPV